MDTVQHTREANPIGTLEKEAPDDQPTKRGTRLMMELAMAMMHHSAQNPISSKG